MRLSSAGVAIGAVALALMWLERRRPLRRAAEPGAARIARNLSIGALTAGVVSIVERPLVERISRTVESRRWGLIQRLPVTERLKIALAILLMDYTLYWWHVLLHRVPALWRLHEPHHVDRDLDTSTGVRFHFAEFIASVPWRCAQVILIGVRPATLALWQKLTLAEVLFHHSNLRLPVDVERRLARLIVTPRMHGLHHSIVREERDAHYSSGLSLWDRLHGSGHAEAPRDDVRIGLPGRAGAARTLAQTLALPFSGRHL